MKILRLILLACLSSTTSLVGAFVRNARPSTISHNTHHRLSTALYSSRGANNNSKRKKSLRDRTQQEATALVQDIIQAAMDAGPRAGPRRTLEAARAVVLTAREVMPDLLSTSNRNADPNTYLPRILRTLFEKLGATYIKLGQFIASSPTLFPKEYVLEFQKCLDQTDPLPWSTIDQVIRSEFAGKPWPFAYIDQTPLASASIAQVHSARLQTGQEVVLKIQKPGIDKSLQADLGFLFVAARVLEFLVPDWERTSLSAVVGDIRQSMLEELDFIKESRNTMQFRDFLDEYNLTATATAPRVYENYTTKRVLTMERLNGVSMLDAKAIATIQDPVTTILTALNIWSLSVSNMPWFHADVHAGNLLLLRDGRVGFIDFGIVGRISPKVFNAVNELSAALMVNDSRAMAQALCNMGATDESVNIDQFARDIERVMQRMSSTTATINMDVAAGTASLNVDENEITDLLLEFVQVTEDNGLKLPREFGLLVKQSLYFDRYLKILAPNVDVMNDSRVMLGGKSRQEQQQVNGASEEVVVEVIP